MFADTTSMTGVILYLITTETETPKNMTKCDGVGMTQTSVSEINTGRESNRCSGGAGRQMHRIELVGAVTSVEHHPRASVLNRKTTFIKFNSNRIFTCKRTNRNKIFNNFRRNENIRHGYRSGVRRKICMSNMGDGKRRTVTNVMRLEVWT